MTEPTTAPPPPGMSLIHNVKLEDFERAVYAREHEPASKLLLAALRKLKQGGHFVGYRPEPEVLRVLYTRFCAAVIAMLADPKYSVSPEGFDVLASEHAVLDLLFRASAFGTSDHLLAMCATNPGPDPRTLQIKDGRAIAKFFLTYSLTSALAMDFEKTLGKDPKRLLSLYAGMLSPLLTVDRVAHERREALLGMHETFADCKLQPAVLSAISDAYMYSSYATRRDKHAIKGTVHRMFARMLKETGAYKERTYRPTRKDRPTLLICVEWFASNHAMYRCYAPVIRQLRSRFRLVGMGMQAVVDDIGRAEFDEWHDVPNENVVLGDLVKTIDRIEPDIIYYPSLGMALWWVALASVRLAPLQVMTLGHPASSRSPEMDAVLCDEGAIGDPELFTERIVTYPNGTGRFIMRPDAELPEPRRDDDVFGVLKIAVPAMLCKLGAPFLETLREIDQLAGRKVEWHFFVNMLGVNLYQAAREIRAWLPEAKVYERRHYNQLMLELRECHLHLSTFPFGGTNSVIDSMLLGLPIVTLWGDEPHARFDGMLIRRARLPESLVAKSREEYVAEALRLIRDDDARNALRDHLLAFDLQGEFFGEPPEGDAFLKAMEELYAGQF